MWITTHKQVQYAIILIFDDRRKVSYHFWLTLLGLISLIIPK